MGAMFRSEEMALAQLFIQPEAAYESLALLGEAGVIQFRDLNEQLSAPQRKFINEVKRCDEMERKIRFIETELKKDSITIPEIKEIPKAPNTKDLVVLEAQLEKIESDMKELNDSAVTLKTNFLELSELHYVLDKVQSFLAEDDEVDTIRQAFSQEEVNRGKLTFVAGVINRERVPAFERMLWRVCRGNDFFKAMDIDTPLEDPKTGDQMTKSVYLIFFQGDQLGNRIKKICTGFHATIYNCPDSAKDRQELLKGVKTRLEDLKLVLNETNDHRKRVIAGVTTELQKWFISTCKAKAIYHTLNCFSVDITNKCLIGEGWVPVIELNTVRKALSDGAIHSGSTIPSFLNVIGTKDVPPTYNKTNKFTKAFQTLIDSYGIASYREVNPALYTIVTFPFLFAVMFGDIGHGFLLFLFGLYMVLAEKKLSGKKWGEMWDIIYGGRYIVLMMGCFSIYTGFIYNDIFSRSVNIFGSHWYVNVTEEETVEMESRELWPDRSYEFENPYPFGVDPVWQVATNKIIFLNSYKMKLSIIFAVTHMIFGVCVSTVNFVYFKKSILIFIDFLPRIIFLVLLFLWMVTMMFMKWIMYGPQHSDEWGTACAPSVLIYFINMMLFKSAEPVENCKDYMFDFQKELQLVLVIVAVCCIPVMLLGTPIYLRLKPRTTEGYGDHDEPFSEIFIHQAIHTIEYVLNTISHTASYLRLWALSLAHAQLSEVVWNMVLAQGLKSESYIGGLILFFTFGAWAVFTVGILIAMEGLSAFLHTLRLHWVEFMSKFFTGLGYRFQPYSFKKILRAEAEKEQG